MHYFMTRRGGSMIYRVPGRAKVHILAGQQIPDYCVEWLGEKKVAAFVADGVFAPLPAGQTPSDSDLGQPDVNPIPVGVGDKEFMPEAKALPGKQRDQALRNLLAEQEARKARTYVDSEAGGSPDGAVKVTLPPEELDSDYDDYEEMLTDREREAISAIERGRSSE
jgi:hypothetical protein